MSYKRKRGHAPQSCVIDSSPVAASTCHRLTVGLPHLPASLCKDRPYIIMAHIVMAYVVMAYIVMTYIVMAHIVMQTPAL